MAQISRLKTILDQLASFRLQQPNVSTATTTPIARLAQRNQEPTRGPTPCSSSSPADIQHRSCTPRPMAQQIILLPTLLRGILRHMSRSKQMRSRLQCTQTSSSRWESMLCFPTEYLQLDNFHNEPVEAKSHRKGYNFGPSQTSLVFLAHVSD
jgi:hypothetical protein